MKEFGGYFQLEHFDGEEYHTDSLRLNSARNALWYLIEKKQIECILLPHFICDSVIDTCKKANVTIEYYNIDQMLLPQKDLSRKSGQWLYLVDYFGVIPAEKLQSFAEKFYPEVILDCTQAFFERSMAEKIHRIYSCRKFFGVPDGAYLSGFGDDDTLPFDCSAQRYTHIVGRADTAASDWYSDFRKIEDEMADWEIKRMSPSTRNILRAINYDSVRKKRRNNFKVYDSLLNEYNALKFDINNIDAPYSYPLFIKNADASAIRKALLSEKIYIPLLWGNVMDSLKNTDLEYCLSERTLHLPVDQRCSEEEIAMIAEKAIGLIKKGEL